MIRFPRSVQIRTHPQIQSSVAATSKFVAESLAQSTDLHQRCTELWPMHAPYAAMEPAMLGAPGAIPQNSLACNPAARYLVAHQAIKTLRAEERRHPQRRWFLVTLINDRWLTSDRRTEIWIGGMRSTSRRVFDLAGFDGWLALIEIQTVIESLPQGGRCLLPHVHAVAWSDDPRFDPQAAQARMCASGRLESAIGARVADISYFENSHPTNLLAYLFKGAAVGKYRKFGMHTACGFIFQDCALRPIAAARQNEILSHLDLCDLLFAGGSGTPLRAELKRHLVGSLRPRGQELTPSIAAIFWRQVKPRHFRHYRPPIIHLDNRQRPRSEEQEAALQRLIAGLYAPRPSYRDRLRAQQEERERQRHARRQAERVAELNADYIPPFLLLYMEGLLSMQKDR